MALFSSFPRSATHVATSQEWRGRSRGTAARSWRGAARAYARDHGLSVAMLADDSAAVFALDHETGQVREWVHPADNLEWV